jgi:hypothetical protein
LKNGIEKHLVLEFIFMGRKIEGFNPKLQPLFMMLGQGGRKTEAENDS